MPSDSGSRWIEMAEGVSPAEATRQGISGLIMAMFGIVIFVAEAFGEGLAGLLGVLDDLRKFIGEFFTAPTIILRDTAQYTADALTQGDWAFFGPATLAVGVVSIAIAWWAWNVLDPEIPFINNLIPWRR